MRTVAPIGFAISTCLCLLVAVSALAGDLAPVTQAQPEFAATSQLLANCDGLGHSDCPCGHCDDKTGLLDHLSLFLGLEGAKQPQDYGVNAHFGGRFAADIGVPLVEEIGLGLQVGTSVNYTDNAVQVLERFGEATGRFQNYTTVGVFQRQDSGLVWGGAVDYLHQTYYDSADLVQFRGRVGWQVTENTEVGFLGAFSDDSDRNRVAGVPVTLTPLSQGSVYFNQRWESQAETMIWLGIAESHGERNLAFEALLMDPRNPPAGERLVFGAEIHVPLNDHMALFGQGNFILPADSGTVDSFLGIAVYPFGGAKESRRSRYAPLLPVANSTTFSVDLR